MSLIALFAFVVFLFALAWMIGPLRPGP